MRNTCIKCNKNYKVLTKEDLCAYCYKDEKGEWSWDFSDHAVKK